MASKRYMYIEERDLKILNCMVIHIKKNKNRHIIWAKTDELAHVYKLKLVCIWLKHDDCENKLFTFSRDSSLDS